MWSTVTEPNPAVHGSSHLLLTNPGVPQENQADLSESSVQLSAQAAHLLSLPGLTQTEVQHRDAHVEAAEQTAASHF